MLQLNQSQTGFIIRIGTFAVSLCVGLLLMLIADNLIADMETAADINTYSWLNMVSGLLFLVSSLGAIAAFRYGGKHEAAIREHKSLSRLLTTYRILFWISIAASVLAVIILVWVVLHLGPVR